MKLNHLITFLVLHLGLVAGTPVDLSDTSAVEMRGLEARYLTKVRDTGAYCWAVSSGVLSNPGYAASLINLHIQMFANFNAPGNIKPGEYKFTSTRNLGVIWTGKVIVIATTSAFTIADAVNDLYESLRLGGGAISARGGTAATRSVSSANVGAFIEMISMVNGGKSYSQLKRDEGELEARASCENGNKEYADCCSYEID
ncbi:hypothetical protein VTL71DRAFT_10722 [Oculimacula yallundae]|uniref:Uncharacterized protein n=1 Tax=Oculimacula yallundae TaxID=86028 RepID=A0ABR4CTT4_9HELO